MDSSSEQKEKGEMEVDCWKGREEEACDFSRRRVVGSGISTGEIKAVRRIKYRRTRPKRIRHEAGKLGHVLSEEFAEKVRKIRRTAFVCRGTRLGGRKGKEKGEKSRVLMSKHLPNQPLICQEKMARQRGKEIGKEIEKRKGRPIRMEEGHSKPWGGQL